MEKTNARARNSAKRYRNRDNTSNVVEIDLQIIVDKYNKQIELLEKQLAKNPAELSVWSTYYLEKEITFLLDLLVSQSLVDNHHFKQIETLKNKVDEIEAEREKRKVINLWTSIYPSKSNATPKAKITS